MFISIKRDTTLNDEVKAGNFTRIFVLPEVKLIDVIKKLDENPEKIILVVDNTHRLLGTVTDGDIRRAMLDNIPLSASVREIMHKKPIALQVGYTDAQAINLMDEFQISYIPILDKKGSVVDIAICKKTFVQKAYSNPVVIMAGGKGKRLMPITETVPKPLVPVGGKPILETIISRLVAQGFSNIHLSVNYKSEMIKDYFGDGKRFKVNISYIEEERELGTAGALGLIKEEFKEPFIAMNSDLLTTVDFTQMLDFHVETFSKATMGVRKYSYDVPFGVVNIENNLIKNIAEKPTQNFFVNAGMYILEPDVFNYIEENVYLDMPSLFSKLMAQKQVATAFPVREYWIDIGRVDELARAEKEYFEHFE